MNIFNQTPHQKKQIEVINTIDQQIKNNRLTFSTVSPVTNFDNDPRICLTSVHLLHSRLIKHINQFLIKPLIKIQSNHYYYTTQSFHATIKNVKTISNPPSFTEKEVEIVQRIFSEVIPKHHKFSVYFYRLLLFPNNLSLMGTTDEQLDKIIFELNEKMNQTGIKDNKQYLNTKYFFCNITLARFVDPINREFRNKVNELSEKIPEIFEPYTIDSVTLLSCNAVFKKRRIIGRWPLLAC